MQLTDYKYLDIMNIEFGTPRNQKKRVTAEYCAARAEMAELGDAADSKSAVLKGAWGFDSPSRHKRNTLLSPRSF